MEIVPLNNLLQLKKELTRHDYRYYVLFNPIITDQNYDCIYNKYIRLLTEVIGLDTHSNEDMESYPEWVKKELGTKRRT